MKQAFIFLTTIIIGINAMAQQFDYTKNWKQVAELVQKGEPKKARAQIEKIYEQSKKDKQYEQTIKSLYSLHSVYKTQEENSDLMAIQKWEKELSAIPEPSQALLQNMVACLYFSIYNDQSWQIRNRSNTIAFLKEDIGTWTVKDFYEKIHGLFQQSLSNKTLLQQTLTNNYTDIILRGNNKLRPTLYDVMANNALDFYKNSEMRWDKGDDHYEITGAIMFDTPANFAKANLPVEVLQKDDHTYNALLIYQQLTQLHVNNNNAEAFIDVTLDRLTYVKENSSMPEENDWYAKALQQLYNTYPNTEGGLMAGYMLTTQNNSSEKNNDNDEKDNDIDYVKKLAALQKIIDSKINCNATILAENDKADILRKSILLTTETVNLTGKPFRLLATYKNTDAITLRIIKQTDALVQKIDALKDDYNNKKMVELLLKQPIVKTTKQPLPLPKDYKQHNAEVKIDELPIGNYFILASIDNNFNIEENMIAVSSTIVSDIAYVEFGNQLAVVNRNTGAPLVNANVQIHSRGYDYRREKYTHTLLGNFKTDKNGVIKTPAVKDDERQLRYTITYKNDKLDDKEDHYKYSYYDGNQAERNTIVTAHIFTDRAIYRPGQELFFKAILTNKVAKKQDSIYALKKCYFLLSDANNQIADTISGTTNKYGSFSGKFVLPKNKMNGNFNITIVSNLTKAKLNSYMYDVQRTVGKTTVNGQAYFKVEEYKRPKFEVAITKPTGNYQLGDSLNIEGTAKAFAGNNIDGAKVAYNVYRTQQTRWYWDWDYYGRGGKRGGYGSNNNSKILVAKGSTVTDANGKFKIPFKAIPDGSIDKETDPIFDYAIEATVTDLNGETRVGNETIAAGYKNLILNINVAQEQETNDFKKMTFSTTNMGGAFTKATIDFTITAFETPNRLLRTRYWQTPDQFILSEAEYKLLFPNDVYHNENNPVGWKKAAIVLKESFENIADSSFYAIKKALPVGEYIIEATAKDAKGVTVKAKARLTINNSDKQQYAMPYYINITSNKKQYALNDKLDIKAYTNTDELHVYHNINTNETLNYKKLTTGNSIINTAITKNDIGGFAINYAFIKHNNLFIKNYGVNVPFEQKELNIKIASHRDKLLPGAQETWKVTLSGAKKEKVAAEMLATMYDASLDAFVAHGMYAPSFYPEMAKRYYNRNFNSNKSFNDEAGTSINYFEEVDKSTIEKEYDVLAFNINRYNDRTTWWASPLEYGYGYGTDSSVAIKMDKLVIPKMAPAQTVAAPTMADVAGSFKMRISKEGSEEVPPPPPPPPLGSANEAKNNEKQQASTPPRTNFNETAFFLPHLTTDANGDISFSFTMPEALTKWKFLGLAHTTDVRFAAIQDNIVTQKDLMVQPFAPRFVREGDIMEYSAKIVNLTDKEITGQALLNLKEASTNKTADVLFQNRSAVQYFTIPAKQSKVVAFPITIPTNFNDGLVHTITATAGNISDGEEATIPVLSNRILVMESVPLSMKTNGNKNYSFDKLKQTGNNWNGSHQSITLEYTSNPAWYALQSLPHLIEYPYECAEQTFNRFYGNALVKTILQSNNNFEKVYNAWRKDSSKALLSNLEKNEELKSVMLQETPWVMEAKNETANKRRIAKLFQSKTLDNSIEAAITKLKTLQSSNGGFVWFKGGPSDRYITQYIVAGLGRMMYLGAIPDAYQQNVRDLLAEAIPYMDRKLVEDYNEIKKNNSKNPKWKEQDLVGHYELQYLYARSFFTNIDLNSETKQVVDLYTTLAAKYWLNKNRMQQGLAAVALHRFGKQDVAKRIVNSLKENAINNEELGMYWKENTRGYYWYESPIETQSLLIEVFHTVTKDQEAVDAMKLWLLKNKQTNNWKTTIATADACYALLLQGSKWTDANPIATIKVGSTTLSTNDAGSVEAGTGYMKKTIEGDKVNDDMGNISVTVNTPNNAKGQPSYGAVYWQYFQNIDDITNAATPITLTKKWFVEKVTNTGKVLQPINNGDAVKVGDKIVARIELKSDRDMEYIHMKDLRAATMEPKNVLSEYKYQDGLGYYETTKDASTNFFMSYLRKGTYVFEYPLYITHKGNFSAGIATIQCMYAPEFTAHSNGLRITVE